jgi:hypothetical protein
LAAVTTTPPPTGLLRLTAQEIKNGWTPASLTNYLRTSTGTDHEFKRELLVRARDFEHRCADALRRFKQSADLDSPAAQKQLAMLEQDLAAARADADFAAERFGKVSEVA